MKKSNGWFIIAALFLFSAVVKMITGDGHLAETSCALGAYIVHNQEKDREDHVQRDA